VELHDRIDAVLVLIDVRREGDPLAPGHGG
jgi:hypothetical protein